MSASLAPTLRAVDEGQRRWFYGGGVHVWKATAEETGGAFTLFEATMDRGKVTPMHTHPTDESMYVLAGAIVMNIDGVEHRIDTGGFVVAPREVPHAFMVVSASATVLSLQTPGTCQDFYFGASEPLTDATDCKVDFDRIRKSAEDNGGMRIVGPPPFAAAVSP